MTLSRSQRILWTVLRWALALIPLVWIYSRLDLGRLAVTIRHVAWWTVPVLALILLSSMFLQGFRWWMLLHAYLPSLRLRRVLISHFAALYYSIVLPTSGAQDVLRAVFIARDNDYGVVWGASVVSRLLGAIVLAVMALYGLFALARDTIPHMRLYATLSVLIITLAILAAFSKRATRPIRRVLSRIIPERFLKVGERIRDGIYRFRSKRAVLLQVFMVTVVLQFLIVANTALLALGITGKLRLIEFLAFIPVIEMVCISLPLTPGGVGIREALLAVMFRFIGIGNEELGVYVALSYSAIVLKLVGIFALPFMQKDSEIRATAAGRT